MAPVGSKREFDNDFNPYAAPEASDYSGRIADGDVANLEYAGFGRRFAAVFIDGFITNVLGFAIGIFIGFVFVGAGVDPSTPGPQALLSLLGLLVSWLYEAGMIASSYQATLGKKAMGIYVTDLDGRPIGFMRSTGRFFGKIISAVILLIGYLMQPFTQKKQALHDIMAGTLVVKSR